MSTENTGTGNGDESESRIAGTAADTDVATAAATDVATDAAAGSVEYGVDADGAAADLDAAEGDPDALDDVAEDGIEDGVYYEDQVEPEYGILGLTLRELILIGAWAVAFIVSFFPALPGGASVWASGIDWILTIGVPTAAVFLVVLRRFSPEGIRRVGSLGIDQFASVAASVSALAWAQLLWRQVTVSIELGAVLVGWVPVLALLAALALVVVTVAAPLIPPLRDDFDGRMETLAHRNANPVRPVIMRPKPAPSAPAATADQAAAASEISPEQPDEHPAAPDERPEPAVDTDLTVVLDDTALPARQVAAEQAADDRDIDRTRVIEYIPQSETLAPTAPEEAAEANRSVADPADEDRTTAGRREPAAVLYTDPIAVLDEIFEPEPGATDDPAEDAASGSAETEGPLRRTRDDAKQPPRAEVQPFWILAGTERDVLDEHGRPLFRIGPDAWALVIEDRGGAYVVRHDDGRIGYLHELTDITKG